MVRGGSLYLQKDPGDQRPLTVVPLRGAEVVPASLGPKHPFSFCIWQAGSELASLEVNNSAFTQSISNVREVFLSAQG